MYIHIVATEFHEHELLDKTIVCKKVRKTRFYTFRVESAPSILTN
jgi:hypothetical protein